MMRTRNCSIGIFGLLVAAVIGCSTQEPKAKSEDSLDIDVTETASALVIARHDTAGLEYARLELHVGRFVMTDDDRGEVDGRQLAVDVNGIHVSHESEGRARLSLPQPRNPGVRDFLLLPKVAAVLSRWGIGIASTLEPVAAPQTEDAYLWLCVAGYTPVTESMGTSCGSCTYTTTSQCGATTCRQYAMTGQESGQDVCCGASQEAANRACLPGALGQNSTCGATGPNGCATCWHTYNGGGCEAYGAGGACSIHYCEPL